MMDSEHTLLLTKLAPIFVYPAGFVVLATIVGLTFAYLGHQHLANSLFVAAVGWLWVASTPLFADWAIATLERQYPAQPIEKMPAADVAIVLGGAVSQPAPPRIDVDFNKSFDRVFQAVRLYHAGRVKKVLVAGGNIPWRPDVIPEAELIRSFLINWGNVPDNAIETTTQSRNTYENALEIKELWQSQPFDSAFLITSAAHMPRAMAVFQKAGIPVAAVSTDIEALEGVPWTPLRWLPDASALAMTTVAIKEWIGYCAYRLRGYL
jgi:uncharacterized SAM-binding protein YcdF (DUF218 family)